jgi:tRNA pseudouridine synthase 10
MTVADDVDVILAGGDCCDSCLGRFFGKRSHGLSNTERGRALRIGRAIERHEPYVPFQGECYICGGLLDDLDLWADRVVAALDGIEFDTFLIGTRVPPLLAECEEMVWSDLSLTHAEPLKSEMNREVGKRVSTRVNRIVDFQHPDVVALLDIAGEIVEIQSSPLFIYGRYRKFERGIPQTHWDCRACRGVGCEKCNFTGKQYADSVEELIGRPLAAALEAEGAILHGSGREDIDARMIGTGRPFIIEIVAPRRRRVDLAALEAAVNDSAAGRVEVDLIRPTIRSEVETLKSSRSHKKYRILVEVDGAISEDAFESALSALKGQTIHQRTPARVVHRRADKVRDRTVLDIQYLGREETGFLVEVLGEAGLYIKELISGDGGRTRPSLAGELDQPARVTRLDVVLVQDPTEEDNDGTSQRSKEEDSV